MVGHRQSPSTVGICYVSLPRASQEGNPSGTCLDLLGLDVVQEDTEVASKCGDSGRG